jgi:hypothetical protein
MHKYVVNFLMSLPNSSESAAEELLSLTSEQMPILPRRGDHVRVKLDKGEIRSGFVDSINWFFDSHPQGALTQIEIWLDEISPKESDISDSEIQEVFEEEKELDEEEPTQRDEQIHQRPSSMTTGDTCAYCGAVHGSLPSVINKWHRCTRCGSVYCPDCGRGLQGKKSFLSGERNCECGGRTVLF